MGSAPRGEVAPGHSPAALPAGDEQCEDVEGEEDAEAEENTAYVGFGCAEPGQALSGGGTLGDLPWVFTQPSNPSPSQTHRLWRVTPSPPVSSADWADLRVYLEEGRDRTQLFALSPACPHTQPMVGASMQTWRGILGEGVVGQSPPTRLILCLHHHHHIEAMAGEILLLQQEMGVSRAQQGISHARAYPRAILCGLQ